MRWTSSRSHDLRRRCEIDTVVATLLDNGLVTGLLGREHPGGALPHGMRDRIAAERGVAGHSFGTLLAPPATPSSAASQSR